MTRRIAVAQLGARMHYGVPRILHRAGMLERLFTDICAVKGWPRALRAIPPFLRPAPLKRLLAREPGIPPEKITAFTGFGFDYVASLRRAASKAEYLAAYLEGGKRFCGLVIEHGLGDAAGVYTFNSAGLELLRHAVGEGRCTLVEQTIAPRAVEERIVREEARLHPQWGADEAADCPELDEFVRREEAEWRAADVIFCGSPFVADGIAECGGPVSKCVVVPYGVEMKVSSRPRRKERKGPLRVLTVGAAGLRKGTPYLLETAKRLKGRAVFRLAGSTARLPEEVKAKLARHVQLLGVVPRGEMRGPYEWADVFFLPSMCEGSATVTYEALAFGLPVVCTPNTGSIIRDGKEGFIVPVRDVPAMASSLEVLAEDESLLNAMSENALRRAHEGSLETYGKRLVSAIEAAMGGR